jgi:HK97 gp10 family phage protein
MSDTNIKGLADLQKALETLPTKMEANIMRGAMRAGVKLMLSDAQHTTGFIDQTGALRDSLRAGTKLKGGTVTASVKAGPTKKDKRPFYAHMIEYGTQAHVIKAKPGSMLAIGVSEVMHPGITPRPFMRTALDRNVAKAPAAVADYIRNRLATKHGIDVPAPFEEGDE